MRPRRRPRRRPSPPRWLRRSAAWPPRPRRPPATATGRTGCGPAAVDVRADRAGDARARRTASVEGWRFAVSQDAADKAAQPRGAADFAAICAGTPAAAGTKRIALVIDPGTAADAPGGATPPAVPYRVCAGRPRTPPPRTRSPRWRGRCATTRRASCARSPATRRPAAASRSPAPAGDGSHRRGRPPARPRTAVTAAAGRRSGLYAGLGGRGRALGASRPCWQARRRPLVTALRAPRADRSNALHAGRLVAVGARPGHRRLPHHQPRCCWPWSSPSPATSSPPAAPTRRGPVPTGPSCGSALAVLVIRLVFAVLLGSPVPGTHVVVTLPEVPLPRLGEGRADRRPGHRGGPGLRAARRHETGRAAGLRRRGQRARQPGPAAQVAARRAVRGGRRGRRRDDLRPPPGRRRRPAAGRAPAARPRRPRACAPCSRSGCRCWRARWSVRWRWPPRWTPAATAVPPQVPPAVRRATAALTLGGLLGVCAGTYGLLSASGAAVRPAACCSLGTRRRAGGPAAGRPALGAHPLPSRPLGRPRLAGGRVRDSRSRP